MQIKQMTYIAIALIAILFIFGAISHCQSGQTAVYRHNGPALLNDNMITPGAVGTMTAAQLCDKSFHTGSVRNVSEATKKLACEEYGVESVCDGKHVEIDHLISLELGGSNDIKNLWPQPYNPDPWDVKKQYIVGDFVYYNAKSYRATANAIGIAPDALPVSWEEAVYPGAKIKDVVEDWLHAQVCANKISLEEAQKEISTDWYAVYLSRISTDFTSKLVINSGVKSLTFECYSMRETLATSYGERNTTATLDWVCPALEKEGTEVPANWVERWQCSGDGIPVEISCKLVEKRYILHAGIR